MINISIVNKSKIFSDAELKTLANALQIQVTRDFFPIWGIGAQIFYTPSAFNPTADHWTLGIFDDADQADALGYHDVTPTGLPMGKVFVKLTLAQGSQVSSTASHELLEMLVDPGINLTAEYDDGSGRPSKFYAYEVCDSPEDDQFGYKINVDRTDVLVSDFVTPAWFESFNKTGPYDFMKKIKAPFEILPGGYIGFLDLANLAAGWQQQLGRLPLNGSLSRADVANKSILARPRVGSRRNRRSLPRSQWVASQYSPSVLGTEEAKQ